MNRKKVVIIGGGFGGLTAAIKLQNNDYDITVIDKTNYHLFQPLLYQVATAALSPGDIAVPIRTVFADSNNVKVIMSKAVSIDKKNSFVQLKDYKVQFDYLIIATGARHSYFGKNEWEKFAPGLKTISDAIFIREKILLSLEEAEKCNPPDYQKYLTYVIVGGGPTGVELAGAIAEIAKKAWLKDFKNINASKTKIYLIEALDRILLPYPDELSNKAQKALESLGVKVLLNKKVTEINDKGVRMNDEFIESTNIIWAAGNAASPLLKSLDTELDKAARVIVQYDLTVKDYSNIFVIGDACSFHDEHGNILPAVAQVAIQQGKYVAKVIEENTPPEKRKPFNYKDKGIMATIGRAKAVAFIKGFKLSGFIAWVVWSFVHIMFLIGFRNRIRVMIEWAWYYITFRHGIRLIVGKKNDSEY